jgi:hypothetical protein
MNSRLRDCGGKDKSKGHNEGDLHGVSPSLKLSALTSSARIIVVVAEFGWQARKVLTCRSIQAGPDSA